MVYLKNYSVILLLLTTLPLLATARNDDWRLVWSDEFNGGVSKCAPSFF